jgi:phage terminase large subunit GpA-like protein
MTTAVAASAIDVWAEQALDAMLGRVFAQLRPRPPLSPIEWAEKYRRLSTEENPDFAGQFRLENTPALRGVLAAAGQKGVRRIVAQKSAQIGWTAGVVCTLMGYNAHWKPCVQVAMFPREKSAKDFDAEKFSPMVRATPVLAKRIKLKSRSEGNSATRKHYPGGLLKFVASNSPADVKSTSAKWRYVEEPDDTNKDVRGQGNSIFLLRERGKAIRNSVEVIGGTPTAKGASEIEKEMRTTDQRRFMVACHHCGERHEVEWAHVVIPGLDLTPAQLKDDPALAAQYPEREVYGRARHEDAYYACPHCGGIWTDDDRVANIRKAALVPPLYGWEPTAEAADPGFYFNELQSVFEGSYVPILAEKFLRAHHLMEQGDTTEMVAFWNATRGWLWEYKGELPEEDELRARAEKYAEWTAPLGGLVPLAFVDVQHDRLALAVWVVGRGEEMWLAYWGEMYGQTVVAHQGAWIELEQLLGRKVQHASGAMLPIVAWGIDCGDGQTSDASYSFVRKHNVPGRPVLATKGASDDEGRVEIWTPPKPIDPNNRATKASRYGVQIHIIGTAKAKDQILGWAQEGGRVRLAGNGPGRMHWYEGVRADFYEQLLSEIKIPSRLNPKRRKWKKRTDRHNELLDCTVGVVWLVRQLRLHLRRPAQWDLDEMRFRQASLLVEEAPPVQTFATEEPAADPEAPSDDDHEQEEAASAGDDMPATDTTAQLAQARLAALLRNRRAARHGR